MEDAKDFLSELSLLHEADRHEGSSPSLVTVGRYYVPGTTSCVVFLEHYARCSQEDGQRSLTHLVKQGNPRSLQLLRNCLT